MGKLISTAVFKSGSESLKAKVPDSFFDFKIKNLDGKVIDFKDYKGKKAFIIVNVACK
jgi:hypothetical protein